MGIVSYYFPRENPNTNQFGASLLPPHSNLLISSPLPPLHTLPQQTRVPQLIIMPRKRSAVGVVDGTTSVSCSDFVSPGGGSRTDLEHLAYTLGLSVDACLAIMNCEGQVCVCLSCTKCVRHDMLCIYFRMSTLHWDLDFTVLYIMLHIHILYLSLSLSLFVWCLTTINTYNIGHCTSGRSSEHYYYRRCILWTTRN